MDKFKLEIPDIERQHTCYQASLWLVELVLSTLWYQLLSVTSPSYYRLLDKSGSVELDIKPLLVSLSLV